MSLVIASQFDKSFNAGLRAHPQRPTVLPMPQDRPWDAAGDADVMLVRPSAGQRAGHALARPAAWPGRLRRVCSGSVGVDFYPRWLLDAPMVNCGRGVASAEIADYVISAIYRHEEPRRRPRPCARGLAVRAAGAGPCTTLGLVGLGSIGSTVARAALALGMRVIAVRRRALPTPVAGVELLDDLAAVVASVDHLVLAVPATQRRAT